MSLPIISLRLNGARLACDGAHRSLLDALEAHQVAVEFQCRSGYCGACRLRLLRGQVKYQQAPLALIQPGEILPCCCLPVADIELEL
ncbi:class I ribonucleotide reductase maintenance protein YfaE [Acerihabitans arboris]|uniref:2Fe-2S ferredoxin-like protein n=1 Tax=Acerihabitans arboris TaxID=2691583 RepID=A0A845SWJ8_9GAMM|nr:class I ribonucleotide reductase maintenance protein YfaE [Acerihabitans arboris]NDL65265.1 2Fe-2S ferredoxin-like protein [Acerihabitans arboris]